MSETVDKTDDTGTTSSSIAKHPPSPSSPPSSHGHTQRRRRPRDERLRYTYIFNNHKQDSLSSIDPLSPFNLKRKTYPLADSTILNIFWTADEKERLFTALARCGKGNLGEVARRVGTKSLVEVTAYVGVLDEETMLRKLSVLGPRRVFDYGKMPAAVEVDDQWIAFEERMATALGKMEDQMSMDQREDDEDMVLNAEKADELAKWYTKSHFATNSGIKMPSPNRSFDGKPKSRQTIPPSSFPPQSTLSTRSLNNSQLVSSGQSTS